MSTKDQFVVVVIALICAMLDLFVKLRSKALVKNFSNLFGKLQF